MKKVIIIGFVLALGGLPAFSQAAPQVKLGLGLDIGLQSVRVGDGDFITQSYATDLNAPGAQGTITVSSNSDFYGAQVTLKASDSTAVAAASGSGTNPVSLGSTYAWYELLDGLYVNAGTSYSFVSFGGLSPHGGDYFWNNGYGITYTLGFLSLGWSVAPVKDKPNNWGYGLAMDFPSLFAFHASARSSGLTLSDFGVSTSLSAIDYLTLNAGYRMEGILASTSQVASAEVAYSFIDPFTAGVRVYDFLTDEQYAFEPNGFLILSPDVTLSALYRYTTDGESTPWDQMAQAKVHFTAGAGGLSFWYQYNANIKNPYTTNSYTYASTLGADFVLTF